MYKTIRRVAKVELVIEKSRFIGHAMPISDEGQVQGEIEKIKKAHWQATHNVPVYLLGDKHTVQRYSDDGEPQGTAGLPVLEMLKHEGLTNLLVVVTRYYGGVKLGTGGLVRAYTETAKLAVHEGHIVKVAPYDCVAISYEYTLQGKVLHFLSGQPVVGIQNDYSDTVKTTFYAEGEIALSLREKLIDLTHGKATLNEPTLLYGCVDEGDFIAY